VAFLWYVARNPRAADRFQAAVEECIDAIAEAPERYPEIEPGIRRRLVLHRFPDRGRRVQVVAVMHTRDDPRIGDDGAAIALARW